MNFLDVAAIFVLVLIVTLIFASTTYDVILSKSNYEPKKVLLAFSLRSNWADLLRMETRTIRCLHGLRAISAFWVVAGHRIFRIPQTLSEPLVYSTSIGRLIVTAMGEKDYAVDVFFLMAGVLVVKSILKAFKGREPEEAESKKSIKVFFFSGRFNVLKFYFNRYLRYMATDAVLLLFYMSSFQESIVDGILINQLQRQIHNCENYWWSNLLLIQNYVNPFETCIPVTWFLSVDFQLFLLSPVFVFLLWKFKYRALWLFAAIVFISQAGIFYIRYTDIVEVFLIHRQTHYRVAQFLVGIALGYIMTELEQKITLDEDGKRMSPTKQVIAWILTISVFAAICISNEIFKENTFVGAFYDATHRIAWTCLIGWIIFACHFLRSGGFVNDFLSIRFWQPFSKMSLSIYMVNYIYIMLTVANTKELVPMQASWAVHVIFGDLIVAVIFGAILYFSVEAPSNLLLKYFLK